MSDGFKITILAIVVVQFALFMLWLLFTLLGQLPCY